jgi:ethanolamine utilization protein EutN
MIIAKVVGTIVTTISHADYKHRKLLVVQPLCLNENDDSGDFVALDNSHAGIGDTVLVLNEGSGARQVLDNKNACVISVIVGIIDSVHIGSTV